MKLSLTLLLLALPLLFVGCEEGFNESQQTNGVPSNISIVDENSATSVTTVTASQPDTGTSEGTPTEGDRKTEIYTFTKPDGTTGNGTKSYIYTDGAWLLTGTIGDEM